MTKKYWLFLLLFAPSVIKAQYTEVINSNRPGYAESPYSVGTGIYQLEGGYQYNTSNKFFENETYKSDFIDQTLRIGAFAERLEIKLLFTYENFTINSSSNSLTKTFDGSYGFGIKYLFLDAKVKNRDHEIRSWKKRTGFHWTMLIPSIALDASVNIGTNATEAGSYTLENIADIIKSDVPLGTFIKPNGKYRIGVFLHNHINYSWVIISNFGFESTLYNNSDYIDNYFAIIAATYNINNHWSTFIESKNYFNEYQNNHDIRAGAAYLIHRNLQLDGSINLTKGNNLKNIGASVGFSYRIDRHKDRFKRVKPVTREIEIDTITGEEKLDDTIKLSAEETFEEGATSGSFLHNVWTDISIFTRNLFLKEENHIPPRSKTKTLEQPERENLLEKEKIKYDSLTDEQIEEIKRKEEEEKKALEDEKIRKAEEKEALRIKKEEEKARKAREREENLRLKEEEQARLIKEKEEADRLKAEQKRLDEIAKIEARELELYNEAVKKAEKEERKEAKRKKKEEKKRLKEIKKIEEEELKLYNQAVKEAERQEKKNKNK